MKNIKKIILLLGILILILIIAIVSLNNKEEKEEIQKNNLEEMGIYENNGQDLKYQYGIVANVKDNNEYYTVKAIAEKYIYTVSMENASSAIDLIADECVKQMQINEDNLNEKAKIPFLNNSREYYNLDINELYYSIEENDTIIYILDGTCKASESGKSFKINIAIVLDTINNTFNIYLDEYIRNFNYTNESIEFEGKSILKRKNNVYTLKNVSDLDMANNYFNNFKNKVLTLDINTLYEKVINKEYASKRFKSLENFREYMKENAETLTRMQIKEYKIDAKLDYVDYVCSDQYDNYYIFRQVGGVMKYSVILDTYTLENENFTKEYSKANDNQKVMMNIDKFITMINSKDYTSAYEKLDETFKKNNFSTLESFKNYIKKNFFEYNSISYESVDNVGEIFIYIIKISDKTASTEKTKELEVIMKLNSNMDFDMSFNI